ncbi:hypothetical protein A5848_001768, partial [Enterococcus faecium]
MFEFEIETVSYRTVSYTHLDVYKRQEQVDRGGNFGK